MEPVHIRGYASAESRATSKPGSPITFIASTGEVARDGLVIDQDGWILDNYRANNVILWSHDYFSRPPIGKGENLRLEDGNLKVDIVFDQDDEFARSIESKVRNGFLNAVSVGWDIKEFAPGKGDAPSKSLVSELLDISVVNIPGDAKALAERAQRSLVDDARKVIALLDPPADTTDDDAGVQTRAAADDASDPAGDESGSVTWEETAAAMVSLYRPFTQRSDEDRKAEHTRLTRAYARFDKTAPEFLTAADVEVLDPSDIRGLFLEGEAELLPALFAQMETRAGKALSARNADDLQRAVDLILGVLERSRKEAESDPADDDAERSILEALSGLLTKTEGLTTT